MVRITVQRLNDRRGSFRGGARRGVMLAWPEMGSSILIMLTDGREMKTSGVERLLATEEWAIFAKTRNSTYRIACEPGDEASWAHMRGDPVPIALAPPDETSPEMVPRTATVNARQPRTPAPPTMPRRDGGGTR